MTKYRLKQIRIDAVQWLNTPESAAKCVDLAGTSFQPLSTGDIWNDDAEVSAVCRSDLVGGRWLPLYTGDYVVLDHQLRLYPLRKAIFEETYEQSD